MDKETLQYVLAQSAPPAFTTRKIADAGFPGTGGMATVSRVELVSAA